MSNNSKRWVGAVAPGFGDAATEKLFQLRDKLQSALEDDTKRMKDGIKYLLENANRVPEENSRDVLEYKLKQYSGLRAKLPAYPFSSMHCQF